MSDHFIVYNAFFNDIIDVIFNDFNFEIITKAENLQEKDLW